VLSACCHRAVDITEFNKGTTADPEDMNELWKVLVKWNGYIDDVQTKGQHGPFTDVANPYLCKEYYGGTGGFTTV